jgi:hypothetical protein
MNTREPLRQHWANGDLLSRNVTVAIFAEFSLYKMEAYYPSLTAGYRLNYYGVPVAYKSDHVNKDTNAKYLM